MKILRKALLIYSLIMMCMTVGLPAVLGFYLESTWGWILAGFLSVAYVAGAYHPLMGILNKLIAPAGFVTQFTPRDVEVWSYRRLNQYELLVVDDIVGKFTHYIVHVVQNSVITHDADNQTFIIGEYFLSEAEDRTTI